MKTSIKRAFALVVMSIVCMFSCLGCALFNDANEEFVLVGEPIFSCVYDEEDKVYNVAVEGYAKNNCDDEWSWVDVTFVLYDENKNIIGTADDSISYLEAQATWHFRAMASTSYVVASVELRTFDGSGQL